MTQTTFWGMLGGSMGAFSVLLTSITPMIGSTKWQSYLVTAASVCAAVSGVMAGRGNMMSVTGTFRD